MFLPSALRTRPRTRQGLPGVIALSEALAWIDSLAPLGVEDVALDDALGRILAEPCPAPPAGVARAAIDGVAVRAAETLGASDYAPLPAAGRAVVAGAALPPGCDAVLPAYAHESGMAAMSLAAGDGVAPKDGAAIPAGARLGPADLAALARAGLPSVRVRRCPGVALLVAPAKAGPDLLTPLLRAAVRGSGGVPGGTDLHLLAGRSGPGPDDDAVRRFDHLHAHGVRLRPGETVALGTIGGAPALLLPGDPVACLATFSVFAARAIRRLGGRAEPPPVASVLRRKISSGLGAAEIVRVRLADGGATPMPPVLASADGMVLVPEGSEGYAAGATVSVLPAL